MMSDVSQYKRHSKIQAEILSPTKSQITESIYLNMLFQYTLTKELTL